MEPLFASGPIWVEVPDVPGSNGTRELLELESAELEVELGGPLIVASDPPSDANVLALVFPTIAYNGDVVMLSPEFAGQRSDPYDWVAGNILVDDLEAIANRFVDTVVSQDFLRGRSMCETTCDYFSFCGGGCASNKYFENGRLDSTETEFCRSKRQAPLDFSIALVHNEQSQKPSIMGDRR